MFHSDVLPMFSSLLWFQFHTNYRPAGQHGLQIGIVVGIRSSMSVEFAHFKMKNKTIKKTQFEL